MVSLGLTLETVLNERRKAQHFYRFAKKQLCAENLDFLFACRQLNPGLGVATFRPLPLDATAQGGAASARYIYDRFIVAAGNHPNRVQVNVKSSTKNALDQLANLGTLGIMSFNQAYQDVLTLVRNDTWKVFASPLSNELTLAKPFWENDDLRGYIQH